MKNRLISITLSLCMIFSSLFLLGGTKDEALKQFLELSETMFASDSKEPKKVYPLKSLDGQEDFVIVEFKNTGYAIFFKETGELLEYNAQSKSPYNKGSKKSYYAGPMNYYEQEDNGSFINSITGEPAEISEETDVSQNIRDLFSQSASDEADTEDSTLIENKIYAGTINTGSGEVLEDTAEGTYIDNAWYFIANPRHGEHRDDIDDPSGTCTVIASQLLLGYHNYFTDRRIIPTENSAGEPTGFLHEDYGDLGMRSNPDSLGTQLNFYATLVEYIDPITNWGQTLMSAKSGIFNYMLDNTPYDCRTNVTTVIPIALTKGILKAGVIEEIDANRPVIIGMDRTVVDSFHVVVCYGYREYENTFGYIVHYGWNDHRFHVWTNSDWYFQYLTMEVDHTHTYEYLGGPYHELHCTECGQSDIRQTHTYTNRYVPYYTDTSMHYAYCTCGAYVFEGHSMSRIQSYSPEYHTVRCKKCFYQTQEEHFFKNGGDICVLCRYDKSGLT